MRRIDLFCKLVGPIAIAFLNGIDTKIAIASTGLGTLGLVLIEYLAIARVYNAVPSLREPKMAHQKTASHGQSMTGRVKLFLHSAVDYIRHPVFLPSFSLALLYLTVLSFNGQMITYLVAIGMSSGLIGLLRGISAIFELSATWLGPKIMARIGPIRSGMHTTEHAASCLPVGALQYA